MSLKETLDALRTAMTEEAKAAYAEILERFDSQMLGRRALKIGDRIPEFVLPNAEGQLVSSAQLLSKHSLIITFYRGSWCPYCSVTLKALEGLVKAQSERIPLALVAISPETGGRASQFKAFHELECEVLIDVDNAIAVQFGVVIRLPKRYQTLLLARGIDPRHFTAAKGGSFPLRPLLSSRLEGKSFIPSCMLITRTALKWRLFLRSSTGSPPASKDSG